jgi:hypothetical protein
MAPQALINRHIPVFVVGFLMVITVVTVVLALVANADGARNPALLASVVVAGFVLTGGPLLMASLRRHAEGHVNAL